MTPTQVHKTCVVPFCRFSVTPKLDAHTASHHTLPTRCSQCFTSRYPKLGDPKQYPSVSGKFCCSSMCTTHSITNTVATLPGAYIEDGHILAATTGMSLPDQNKNQIRKIITLIVSKKNNFSNQFSSVCHTIPQAQQQQCNANCTVAVAQLKLNNSRDTKHTCACAFTCACACVFACVCG